MPFGKHANMFSGRAPLKDIFREEVSGQHMKKTQMVADWGPLGSQVGQDMA